MSGVKRQRLACSRCTRRKVKCDKADPCSNCVKVGLGCVHDAVLSPRPRKRGIDDERLAQLARYEDLMRQHNIDFSGVTNAWVSSSEHDKSNARGEKPSRPILPSINNTQQQGASSTTDQSKALRWCSWSGLCPELKYPAIKKLRPVNDPILVSAQQPFSLLLESPADFKALHPEPRHIYRLWHVFVERVNPLIKIVHIPTLQQQVMDASWDPANASPSLTAILFAVYNLATAAMFNQECVDSFGETRDNLILRYRSGNMRALVAAEFMTSRDFAVLQALVLFLMSDPDSELTCTLCGVALRLGHKMGLDRGQENTSVSFFECEMRIRLWWALSGMDARFRRAFSRKQKAIPTADFGNVRLPLNVNDADLHPDMKEAPIEHNIPTEMRCVLMKYELSGKLLSSPAAATIFNHILQDRERTPKSIELATKAIDDLTALYQDKYLRYSDTNIPLHRLTHAAATLAIACWHFMAGHPRLRVPLGSNELHMTQQELDALFEQALTGLQMLNIATHSVFPPYLVSHLFGSLEVDILVFVLSELRQRYVGDRVRQAWKLVEDLFNDHPELIEETNNSLYAALGSLALEAWDARRKSTVLVFDNATESGHCRPPPFIYALRDKRFDAQLGHAAVIPQPDAAMTEFDMFLNSGSWDWDYWTELLQ